MPSFAAFHLPQLQIRRGSIGNPLPNILGGSKERSPEDGIKTRLPALRNSMHSLLPVHQMDTSPYLEKANLRLTSGSSASFQTPSQISVSQSSTNCSCGSASYTATPIFQSQVGSSQTGLIVEGLTGIASKDTPNLLGLKSKYKDGEITAVNRMIRMYTSHNLRSIYELRQLILGYKRYV